MKVRYKELKDKLEQAKSLDHNDPFKDWRKEFLFPIKTKADFRGNSLGPMPGFEVDRNFEEFTKTWRKYGHDGHFHQDENTMPWWRYHEMFEKNIAVLLGSDVSVPEAVVGNTLSVNNYILLLKFLRLARDKSGSNKIVSLSTFFNSDQNSIKDALNIIYGDEGETYNIVIKPDQKYLYSTEYLEAEIAKVEKLAIIFIPAICHQTGQRFDMDRLAIAAHEKGAYIGIDLAHAVGNIPLELSKWNIDFATFCSYKYLNGGPGGVGGLYVNKKHIDSFKHSPGWWGSSPETRFGDPSQCLPSKGSRRFLASNDQIANMQGLLTYFEKIDKRFGNNLTPLFRKHKDLSQYAYDLLSPNPYIEIITPENFNERGAQISFKLPDVYKAESTVKYFSEEWKCFIESRGEILRAAFTAYNTYSEVAYFAKTLHRYTNFYVG